MEVNEDKNLILAEKVRILFKENPFHLILMI